MKLKINYDICGIFSTIISVSLIFTIFAVYDRYGIYVASFNMFLAIVFCGLNYYCLRKGTEESSKEVDDLIKKLNEAKKVEKEVAEIANNDINNSHVVKNE